MPDKHEASRGLSATAELLVFLCQATNASSLKLSSTEVTELVETRTFATTPRSKKLHSFIFAMTLSNRVLF